MHYEQKSIEIWHFKGLGRFEQKFQVRGDAAQGIMVATLSFVLKAQCVKGH